MIKISYPKIGKMYGAGTLHIESRDIWQSDTKKERRKHFRTFGYNVKLCCSHYTFANIHTDTKSELMKAIVEAMEKTRKIITSKLRGGSIDYDDRKNRVIARRFVKEL